MIDDSAKVAVGKIVSLDAKDKTLKELITMVAKEAGATVQWQGGAVIVLVK